jgi:hypothetical protein
VVAKRRTGIYRPGHRGWVKIKNPDYWRRESEIAGVRRSVERRPKPPLEPARLEHCPAQGCCRAQKLSFVTALPAAPQD